MTSETLLVQLKSLGMQLRVVEEQAKGLSASAPRKDFADLYGILKGKVSSSEADIAAAEFRPKWGGETRKR